MEHLYTVWHTELLPYGWGWVNVSEIHSAHSWLVGWNCLRKKLHIASFTLTLSLSPTHAHTAHSQCNYSVCGRFLFHCSLLFNKHTSHLTEWCIFIILPTWFWFVGKCCSLPLLPFAPRKRNDRTKKNTQTLNVLMKIYLVLHSLWKAINEIKMHTS